MSVDELQRLERVHVRAWPALETARVSGWLWRYSGGGSQRANSVSAVDFNGDVDIVLHEVEARYRAKNAPARFHSFSACRPQHLPQLLQARGYKEAEPTLTMAKHIGEPTRTNVEARPQATQEWLDVYLGAITENRRVVNTRILDSVPQPCAFFALRDGGSVISTALCVKEPEPSGGFAVIECVATRQEARRRGGARTVLAAIEAYARGRGVHLLGLQVSQANPAAISLYASLGFEPVDENRFWVQG